MKIKKGDKVKVRGGKDRGKTGVVLKVFPIDHTVMVEGINLVKKRTRSRRKGSKGETVLVPRPLAVSRVMNVCGSCGKPTRIGYRYDGDAKVRYCKKCNVAFNS